MQHGGIAHKGNGFTCSDPHAHAQLISGERIFSHFAVIYHSSRMLYEKPVGHLTGFSRIKRSKFYDGAILDAAVIRKADEEAGEVPKAFVVLKPDAASKATTGEAIMAFVAERVAPHKRIRHLEFIEQIPKSPSGKILRRMLVQMEKERAS